MARGSALRPRAISALPLRCRDAAGGRRRIGVSRRCGGCMAARVRPSSICRTTSPTKDIELARLEGYGASEHVKRYTTLGMGTDQGKTANVVALGVLAELTGAPIPAIGTTAFARRTRRCTWRALAGHHRGKDFRPKRLPPSHVWAEENGAVFADAGLWLRAQWYPQRPARRIGCKASRARPRRCATPSASAMSRRSARSTFRGRTPRRFSTASTSTHSRRCQSARRAMA